MYVKRNKQIKATSGKGGSPKVKIKENFERDIIKSLQFWNEIIHFFFIQHRLINYITIVIYDIM